jgi:transposase
MISSIRLDGSTACMAIDSATDTEVFQTYVRQVLCPTLRPGDVVIMDNLSPHKNEQTLALIATAGAEVRFLPAYSPDLNPIEKMWSKVKTLLRGAEARTWRLWLQPSPKHYKKSHPRTQSIGSPHVATVSFKTL